MYLSPVLDAWKRQSRDRKTTFPLENDFLTFCQVLKCIYLLMHLDNAVQLKCINCCTAYMETSGSASSLKTCATLMCGL